MTKRKQDGTILGWRLLILLTAVFLRLYKLATIPPGLTHDEADHGITAWSIAHDGVRELYFTIGYGREPLYDYVTAVLMKITGPTHLAPRLVAAWAGILLVAAMYRWVRDAFDERTALFTAAGLAVGFWAMATSRQALRSELLPLLFVLAMVFYWKGVASSKWRVASGGWYLFVVAGIFLGLTFYTYIPSRGLWFVFPLLFGFGWLTSTSSVTTSTGSVTSSRHTADAEPVEAGAVAWRNLWKQTAVTLIISLLIAAPLFNYLRTHPNTEGRIDELKTPITAVFDGNFTPLLQNIIAGIKIIGIDGDWIVRYNIPHQPLLPPVMFALFILQLLLIFRTLVWQAIAYKSAGKSFFAHKISVPLFTAILWLLAGLAPVLITGPEWSFTQAMGMQPVLYLFPALALAWLRGWVMGRGVRVYYAGVLLLFGLTAVSTTNAYFNTWAQDPAVRVQYESTMTAAMQWINASTSSATDAPPPATSPLATLPLATLPLTHIAISTITPAAPHTPALAQMMMHNADVTLHYFDARAALLLPDAPQSSLILPSFTPIPPAMERYWRTATLTETLPLRPDDEDRPLDMYTIERAPTLAMWADQFTINAPAGNEYLEFLGYDLQTTAVSAGEAATVATLWRVKRPLPQANLFTHVQGADGAPIAQADRLDVPGDGWQTGDYFIQLHDIPIPPQTPSGRYPLAVGLCQRQSAADCTRIGDLIPLEIEIEIE